MRVTAVPSLDGSMEVKEASIWSSLMRRVLSIAIRRESVMVDGVVD
jgi:hypothetical protein